MKVGLSRVALVMLISVISHVSFAEPQKERALPTFIKADHLYYHQEKNMATADGNVEVMYGERLLYADRIIYHHTENRVEAIGNVSLMEPTGTVVFAHQVELRDGLKDGVVEHFQARFENDALLAGRRAVRSEGKRTLLEKVVFSPCPVCEDNPEKAPMWQLKAKKATLDQEKQKVKYNHASLEVYGTPVFYTPYFSHASPDADRKSGFLMPSYQTSSYFGTQISTPYYFNLAPNYDVTLTPTFTTRRNAILAGEYRHLLRDGYMEWGGSITDAPKVSAVTGEKVEGTEIRGHIRGKGSYRFNDVSSIGFDAMRSSDDTYLRRYNYSFQDGGFQDMLTSRIYQENIWGRSFIRTEAMAFQGLRFDDDPGETPFILPELTIHLENDELIHGMRFFLDGNALVLGREEGAGSNRLSLTTGAKRVFITPQGHVLTGKLSLRGDGYYVDDVPDPENPGGTVNGTTGRVIPEAQLSWSYPLMRASLEHQLFLEPVVQMIVSPYGGNPDKIPNEDSQDVEFSHYNIFDAHHYHGLDLVESGPRLNYGLRGGLTNIVWGNIDFLLGQNYRMKRDGNFTERTGLNDYASDYVGRIGYQNDGMIAVDYHFRLDEEEHRFNRNGLSSTFDLSPLRLSADYLWLDEVYDNDTGRAREEVVAGGELDLTEHWIFRTNARRDLDENEWIYTRAGLVYEGECLNFMITYLRSFTRDRDIRPDSTVSFQIGFDNFGL